MRRVASGWWLAAGVWLGGCSDPATAKATSTESYAVARDASGKPALVMVHYLKSSKGKSGSDQNWRIDSFDLDTGQRTAHHLFPEPPGIQNPQCYGGPAGTLWCTEGPEAPLVLRDLKTLAIDKDTAALGVEHAALRQGIKSVGWMPGTDTVTVTTDHGERWCLGQTAAPCDDRHRAEPPSPRLELRAPSGGAEAMLVVDESSHATGLTELKDPKLVPDLTTRQPLRWPDEKLALMTHGPTKAGLAVIALGFDGKPKWTKHLQGQAIRAATATPDRVVLALSVTGDPSHLIALRAEDGTVIYDFEF